MNCDIALELNNIVEMLAILVFLCGLYSEKFHMGYKEIICLCLDLFILGMVNNGHWPMQAQWLIYVLLITYCIWRFGWNFRKLAVNFSLNLVMLGCFQLLIFWMLVVLQVDSLTEGLRNLCGDSVLLLLCIILYKSKVLEKISYFFRREDIILKVILLIGTIIIVLCLAMKKILHGFYVADYVFVAVAILLVLFMAVGWQRYKIKAKESEMELQAYRIYEDSYQNLITEIRLKQHEFNNHVNAIYNQHLLCQTYEELVNRQREYCKSVVYDNRYEKLLKAGKSVLIGFLYGKFVEAENRNIVVSYDIQCMEFQTKIPVYKLVELVGNLLNNAMDALEKQQNKRLHVSIIEEMEYLHIEIRNISEVVPMEQISQMFRKGYSSKGNNRGLGLYSLKKMGREYGFDIVCSNTMEDDINWISFAVRLEK